MKRNLIYHFYPEKTKFDFHYQNLIKYKDLFNGRRIICFSLKDSNSVYNLEEIQNKFSDFEIRVVDNDQDARETKSLFQVLLPEIINEPGITFFGHSKSNSDKRLLSSYSDIHTLWTKHLYESNLDNINLVDHIMQTNDSCGSFIRTSNLSVIPTSKWHYSGTMYWLKNESLKNKINEIETYQNKFGMNRYGAEGFPGSIFDQNKSYCLFDFEGDLGAPVTNNVLLNYNNKNKYEN